MLNEYQPTPRNDTHLLQGVIYLYRLIVADDTMGDLLIEEDRGGEAPLRCLLRYNPMTNQVYQLGTLSGTLSTLPSDHLKLTVNRICMSISSFTCTCTSVKPLCGKRQENNGIHGKHCDYFYLGYVTPDIKLFSFHQKAQKSESLELLVWMHVRWALLKRNNRDCMVGIYGSGKYETSSYERHEQLLSILSAEINAVSSETANTMEDARAAYLEILGHMTQILQYFQTSVNRIAANLRKKEMKNARNPYCNHDSNYII